MKLCLLYNSFTYQARDVLSNMELKDNVKSHM